jgi:hypothetical protein
MLDRGVPRPVQAPRPSMHVVTAVHREHGGCRVTRRPLPMSLLGGRRFYSKMKSAWLQLTTLDVHKPELGSWTWIVDAPCKSSHGGSTLKWGVCCWICHVAFNASPPSTCQSLGVRGTALDIGHQDARCQSISQIGYWRDVGCRCRKSDQSQHGRAHEGSE